MIKSFYFFCQNFAQRLKKLTLAVKISITYALDELPVKCRANDQELMKLLIIYSLSNVVYKAVLIFQRTPNY